MKNDPVRSTIFYTGRHISKQDQEQLVGKLFAEGYEYMTGIKLEGNVHVEHQPPDRIFFCQGKKIGVEMFELEQFYATRAEYNQLTNEVYSEFERRAPTRYVGVVITLPILIEISGADSLDKTWQTKGISGKRRSIFARELVDLFIKNVPSTVSIPEDDLGLVISVNEKLYPAVSALVKRIVVNRCPNIDSRRTDGKAAPLVIIGPSIRISDSDIEESIRNKLFEKIENRPRWNQPVHHSILIAHEIPRGRIYQGFAAEWYDLLARAASALDLLNVFDEFWLVRPFRIVTSQDKVEDKARRICGKGLS